MAAPPSRGSVIFFCDELFKLVIGDTFENLREQAVGTNDPALFEPDPCPVLEMQALYPAFGPIDRFAVFFLKEGRTVQDSGKDHLYRIGPTHGGVVILAFHKLQKVHHVPRPLLFVFFPDLPLRNLVYEFQELFGVQRG
jgi:hypothetical protein